MINVRFIVHILRYDRIAKSQDVRLEALDSAVR